MTTSFAENVLLQMEMGSKAWKIALCHMLLVLLFNNSMLWSN
jgi:hypothetical protein